MQAMEMHTHEPRVLADSWGIQELQTFDAPGFASQFVKRHPEYVKDRERLQEKERHGTLDPAEADAFARRWGLLLPDDE